LDYEDDEEDENVDDVYGEDRARNSGKSGGDVGGGRDVKPSRPDESRKNQFDKYNELEID